MSGERLSKIFRVCIGLSGIFFSLIIIKLAGVSFPPLHEYFTYLIFSFVSAILYLSVGSTVVSFEIALFLFLTFLYGPEIGSFSAMLTIFLVWLSKSVYFHLRKERLFTNTFLAGCFNAGLYAWLYYAGGIVFKTLGDNWLSYLITIMTIIFLNELIFTIKGLFDRKNLLKYFKEEGLLSDFLELLIYPLGITVYLLYQKYGFASTLPILGVIGLLSALGRLYSVINSRLKKNLELERLLNILSRDLSETFDFARVLFKAEEVLSKIFHGSFLYFEQSEEGSGELGNFRVRERKITEYDKNEIKKFNYDFARPVIKGDKVLGTLYLHVPQKISDSENIFLNNLLDLLSINLAKVVSYKASIFDSLTGLYTRGFFEERMKSEIEKIKRGGGRFTLVMLDIDNLKYINDKFGHDKGDEVILRFASSLKSQTRQSDLPARWGGDEFVLILSGVSEEKADEVVNRILKRFHSEDIQFSEPDFKPGVSYAVVEYNESSHFGLAELFKIVDSRLLEVKRKKKGGEFYG